jgi:hypothetical protein
MLPRQCLWCEACYLSRILVRSAVVCSSYHSSISGIPCIHRFGFVGNLLMCPSFLLRASISSHHLCIDRSTQLRGGLRIALYLRHSACVRDTCGGLT